MTIFLRITLALSLTAIGFCLGAVFGSLIYIPEGFSISRQANMLACGAMCSITFLVIGTLEGVRLKPKTLKKSAFLSVLATGILLSSSMYLVF